MRLGVRLVPVLLVTPAAWVFVPSPYDTYAFILASYTPQCSPQTHSRYISLRVRLDLRARSHARSPPARDRGPGSRIRAVASGCRRMGVEYSTSVHGPGAGGKSIGHLFDERRIIFLTGGCKTKVVSPVVVV